MCPACMAAMAITAAKVVSIGGLAAWGAKKLVASRVGAEDRERSNPEAPLTSEKGDSHEEVERRIP